MKSSGWLGSSAPGTLLASGVARVRASACYLHGTWISDARGNPSAIVRTASVRADGTGTYFCSFQGLGHLKMVQLELSISARGELYAAAVGAADADTDYTAHAAPNEHPDGAAYQHPHAAADGRAIAPAVGAARDAPHRARHPTRRPAAISLLGAWYGRQRVGRIGRHHLVGCCGAVGLPRIVGHARELEGVILSLIGLVPVAHQHRLVRLAHEGGRVRR